MKPPMATLGTIALSERAPHVFAMPTRCLSRQSLSAVELTCNAINLAINLATNRIRVGCAVTTPEQSFHSQITNQGRSARKSKELFDFQIAKQNTNSRCKTDGGSFGKRRDERTGPTALAMPTIGQSRQLPSAVELAARCNC